MSIEHDYLWVMKEILEYGEERKFDKCIPTKSVWLWFIRGPYTNEFLHEHNCHIWDKWFNDDGSIKLGYRRWRNWGGVDQLKNAIETIKNDPTNRRILVSSWDGSEIEQLNLPPCHVMYQFYTHGNGGLSLFVYQRSADWFLGVPFNIASYSLLLLIVCKLTGRFPESLTYQFGDVHLYENQFNAAEIQLGRVPYDFPEVYVNDLDGLESITHDDFELVGYNHHSRLVVPVVKV